jgi:putative inorganic carbon (HCO3(-)) transporter
MKTKPVSPTTISKNPFADNVHSERPFTRRFTLLFGLFLGLTLVKFGNAAIMERYIERPKEAIEWLLNPWPVDIAFWILGFVTVCGICAVRWRMTAPVWVVLLPLAWLIWQFIAATRSVDAELSATTLRHFTACVVCFYLGHFAVSSRAPLLFAGIITGFALVIAVGMEQHFGGLEESRKFFYAEIYPKMHDVPPEYLKKINSNRIWATLFYPNALAGVILLLLPPTLVVILRNFTRLTLGARQFVAVVFALGGLGCLYWSQSKGGWLLMLLLILVALLHLNFSRRLKLGLITAVVVLGLAGFAVKYAGFFKRGATSVSARFDYWRAAVETTVAHPVFGTGPGTFAIPYAKIKRPESEMSRMVHNDYVEQASDSGLLGFALYAAFAVGVLWLAKPRRVSVENGLPFAIWLGLLGWLLQGLMEFGLYIPALAWTGFALTGWMLRHAQSPRSE